MTKGRYLAGGSSGAPFGSRHGQSVRYDRATGELTLVSVSPQGDPGTFGSYATDISADGQTVLFNTSAANIAPEGDNRPQVGAEDQTNDVFVATISPPK